MFQLISGDDIGFWIWEIILVTLWDKFKENSFMETLVLKYVESNFYLP